MHKVLVYALDDVMILALSLGTSMPRENLSSDFYDL